MLGCLPIPSMASLFFVSPLGDDTKSGTSPSNAKKSIQLIVEIMRPGDTLRLLPGTYTQNIETVRSGSADAPISIVGTDDSKLVGNEKNRNRVVAISHSYIRLEGFEINGLAGSPQLKSNFANKLIYVAAKTGHQLQGIQIKSLKVSNARGECIRFKNVSLSLIANNHITHCGIEDYKFSGGQQNGEAIYIGTAPEQLPLGKVDESVFNHVVGNQINVYGSECIDLKEGANYTRIFYNYCANALAHRSGAISIRSSNNLVKYNTIVSNQGAGIRIGADVESLAINNIVEHNELIENQHSAIKIMNWPQANVCKNKIQGNNRTKAIRVGPGIDGSSIVRCNYYAK